MDHERSGWTSWRATRRRTPGWWSWSAQGRLSQGRCRQGARRRRGAPTAARGRPSAAGRGSSAFVGRQQLGVPSGCEQGTRPGRHAGRGSPGGARAAARRSSPDLRDRAVGRGGPRRHRRGHRRARRRAEGADHRGQPGEARRRQSHRCAPGRGGPSCASCRSRRSRTSAATGEGGAPFLLAVDGVTDPGNLGALMRIAECAGVTGVVLPKHRAVHVTPTVTKAAAGAVEYLPMALVGGLPAAIESDEGGWNLGRGARCRGRHARCTN